MVRLLFTEKPLSGILSDRSDFFLRENKRQTGTYYEELAAEYLKGQGLSVIEKNFRCRQGEIDLIARDGEYLVFVEVKYRQSEREGSSLAAVHKRKQRVICRTAWYYLAFCVGNMDIPCRFDVVGIDGKEEEISWVKNAFDFCT